MRQYPWVLTLLIFSRKLSHAIFKPLLNLERLQLFSSPLQKWYYCNGVQAAKLAHDYSTR